MFGMIFYICFPFFMYGKIAEKKSPIETSIHNTKSSLDLDFLFKK